MLTQKEIVAQQKATGAVKAEIFVDFDGVVMGDIDTMNEVVSMAVLGTNDLQDISWEVIGHEGAAIKLSVCGDATEYLDEMLGEGEW